MNGLPPITTATDIINHRQIFQHLATPEKRRDIVHVFWTSQSDDPDEFNSSCFLLAQVMRMRPQTIAKFPVYKRIDSTLEHFNHPLLEDEVACALEGFFTWNVTGEDPDSNLWDLVHKGLAINSGEEEPNTQLLSEQMNANLKSAGQFSSVHDIQLCLAMCYLNSPSHRCIVAAHLNPLIKQTSTMEGGEGQVRVDAAPGSEDSDEFTTVDNLLIRNIVDSMSDIEGALSEDQVFDAVDELIHLNSHRHRSYFHLGFAQTLFEKDICFAFSEQNTSRRAWLMAGHVKALVRKRQTDAIAKLFLTPDTREICEEILSFANSKTTNAPARMISEHIFDALWQSGSGQDAIASLRPWVVRKSPLRFVLRLKKEAANAIREGNYAAAEKLLDVLEECCEHASRSAAEKQAYLRSGITFEVIRRRAQCLAARGHFEQSQQKLEALLHDHPEAESAQIRTDLGLVCGNFKRIADVKVPAQKNECSAMVNRLNRGIEHYRKALESSGDATNAEYILGVLALIKEKQGSEALNRLATAYYGATQNREIYQLAELYGRIELYYALAILIELDEPKFRLAVDHLQSAATSDNPASWPDWLMKKAFECVKLDTTETARVLDWAIQHRAHMVEELVHSPELLRKSYSLQRILLEKIDSPGMRTSGVRWADNEALLKAALQSGQQDQAAKALDNLEVLAIENPHLREQFIQLISKPENYEPVWKAWDALESLSLVPQQMGDHHAAITPLCEIFYNRFNDESVGAEGLDEAEGILERMEAFGVDDKRILDARTKLEKRRADPNDHDEPDELKTLLANHPLKILFIGGNEMQAKWDQRLISVLRNEHPALALNFRHTGWKGGWGTELEKIKKAIPQHDFVIIMRFIRTELGRSVREHCGKENIRWFACTGHGESFIKRIIEKSAATFLSQGSKEG